jgi:hypothetical protein
MAREFEQFPDGGGNGQHLFRHSGGKGMFPRLGADFLQAFRKSLFAFPVIAAASFPDYAHQHKKRDKHKSACQDQFQHRVPACFNMETLLSA